MQWRENPRFRVVAGYVLAIVLTLFTFWLRVVIGPYFQERPMMVLFTLPIVLSAYLGGAGPGVFSTVFSVFLLSYFLMPPVYSLVPGKDYDVFQLSIFAAGGVMVSVLSESLRRARNRTNILLAELTVGMAKQKEYERALHQREELFRTYVEKSPVAIMVSDRDGYYVFGNPAAEKMYGYSLEEMLSKHIVDLTSELDHEAARQHFARVIKDGYSEGEVKMRKKNGDAFWVLVLAVPQGDDRVIAYCIDVNDRRELEARLLRNQRLESVGRLASGVAHDINNIMAPVLAAPVLLREGIHDAELREVIDSVEVSARRATAIVRQLLTFGRGEEMQRAPMSLRPLVKEMVKLMKETFPRNIEIRTEYPPDYLYVNGDTTQLHQLLMNLCVNARDAMPDGGIMTLRLEETAVTAAQAKANDGVAPGPHLRLTVSDTGTGIPPELVGKIFDPFFTTKPLGEGTGLGLATAMGIVRGHNGFFDVVTHPGQGTTFHVYLPLVPKPVVSPQSPEEQARSMPRGRGERILLVDDEEGVRKVLGKVLRRYGYDVAEASNGEEGLAMLNAGGERFQLLLTDLMMPQMDGWVLIPRARGMIANLKIIAMSGNHPDAEAMQSIQPFIVDVLNKPCTASMLLLAVRAALDGQPVKSP
jgi:two-component system, cell cycle sensor histidine kinase and response regulator CckA